MKKYFAILVILIISCSSLLFADMKIYNFLTLPGNWTSQQRGDAKFHAGPTAQFGIIPDSSFTRDDKKYFGYYFKYEVGYMSGTGSPMMGDYEPFEEYESYTDMMEADFRSLLEKYRSDLKYQTFSKFEDWHVDGNKQQNKVYNVSGYAEIDGKRYGFVSLDLEYDWGAHFAAFIFCDENEFDSNLMEMRKMLGL